VPKPELVAALATLTMPALIGPMLGPPLGGLIVTYADWRWIFLVNIPIGIAGVALATIYFNDETPERTPLDVTGFVLCALALLGLILGATALGRHVAPGWSIALSFAIGAGAALLYVRHARTAAHPLLDLGLFALPSFDAGITGGSLFRLGVGASAFLLPLMLQLGFGLSPMTSGLLTFASAVGALAMKPLGSRILKTYGFKRVLIVNGILGCLSVAVMGLFTAATPLLVISAVVLLGGIFRSLQFTSMNALTYADVSGPQSGAATSMGSVAQQVSVSLGVALGALVLELSQHMAGRADPGPQDYSMAFFVVAAASALCLVKMFRLPPDVGRSLTAAPRAATVEIGAEPAPPA